MAAFAAVTILTSSAALADDEVLYWMIDASSSVDDGGKSKTIKDFVDAYTTADSSVAARIRVTGGNITEDTFLDLHYPDGSNWDGTLGVDFVNNAGYWGAGVPVGNQSPVADYSAGSPEYSFIVEIGNVTYDASSDTASWSPLAVSDAATYSDLGAYIHAQFDMNPASGAVWNAMSFRAVPEPSGGLLTAMGLALLALRRRRFSKGA
jgi:hypothetical protein